MLPYYLVFISVIIFGLLARHYDYNWNNDISATHIKHTRLCGLFYFFAACVLMFIAATRYYVGADYGGYYKFTDIYANSFLSSVLSLDEPGYRLIAVIARFLSNEPATAVIIATVIIVGLILITLYHHSKWISLVLILYFLLEWTASFNGVRQALAVSIVFSGFGFLRGKKFWKYAICVFVGFLFHRSAILMILPYFYVHRRLTWKSFLALSFLTIIIFYSYNRLFDFTEFVMQVEYSETNSYIWSVVRIERVLAGVAPACLFVFMNNGKNMNEGENFYTQLCVLHAVIGIITSQSTYLARMSMYTSPFLVISIPELLKQRSKNNQRIILILMIVLYAVFMWVEVHGSSSLNNYRFLWER